MNTIQNGLGSMERIRDLYLDSSKNTAADGNTGASFGDILSSKIEEKVPVRFSKHASLRLSDRGIDLTKEQTDRLIGGIERAKDKGISESLVMMDELMFIVNVDRSTVITAMDKTDSDVFTNIDGAVIV